MARRKKAPDLTNDLATLLKKTLVPDLKKRSKQPAVETALKAQHAEEKKAGTTGAGFNKWRNDLIEQVGAAWVLSVVFVRTLEMIDALDQQRIADPGASDSEQLFFELAPHLTARDYLLTVFKEVSRLPGATDILGPERNLAWRLSPSDKAARKLLDYFRKEDDDGEFVYLNPEDYLGDNNKALETRFLGDLYQDLSENVRKKYALLQTPDFVESYILDKTLEPAIETFGLETVRVIDPTCGSGHFLLGAFWRLFEHRQRQRPGEDDKTHALDSLNQVYGADINPYAVAIARFRLTLAYMDAVGATSFGQVPHLPLNLVVADSLLAGKRDLQLHFVDYDKDVETWQRRPFTIQNPTEVNRVFKKRYHAVVGNPPYITCKDKAQRDAIREIYESAYRQYGLHGPFTERFIKLAVDEGFIGEILSNNFMKRLWGKNLVEEVLPKVDVTRVVDSSGAYIPGHGTPTALLFARNRPPVSDEVHGILGKRGEPSTPDDPAEGVVWSSIATHGDEPGFENDYISVDPVPRNRLSEHPWSLQGGGASELKALLEERAETTLGDVVDSIGFACITKQDDVFAQDEGVLERHGIKEELIRPFGIGEAVRDWSFTPNSWVIFPYDDDINTIPFEDLGEQTRRFLWKYRTVLEDRKVFGGQNYREADKPWWEYGQIPAHRFETPLSITFAFVATHNHFVLDRGGKVFNRTAPIIKLQEGATEEEHLALLGYLNSSVACFYLKQICFQRTVTTGEKVLQPDLSRVAYEFAGTLMEELPLPDLTSRCLLRITRAIDDLAIDLTLSAPQQTLAQDIGTVDEALRLLQAAEEHSTYLHDRLVALQEELDWLCYQLLGIDNGGFDADHFEHVLLNGEVAYHESERPFISASPPPCLSERTKLWELRAELGSRRPLKNTEWPMNKRRWAGVQGRFQETGASWRKQVLDAVEDKLLLEAESFVEDEPQPMSLDTIVRRLERTLWGRLYEEITKKLERKGKKLIEKNAIPFSPVLMLKDSGLEKLDAWKETWSQQRREDKGGSSPDAKPPRFTSTDFQGSTYYRLRGKLNVPQERFISYPGCEREEDPSPLYGWAGWDHLQRAQALAALYVERKTEDGWKGEKLVPMLAGLWELVPWLKQWHNEPNPDYDGERLGDYFETFVEGEAREIGWTTEELEEWRP